MAQQQQQQQPGQVAFTGFPCGRSAESSSCWMLDLARLGRSSRRYPIAPDGYIPNSTIRALFDEPPPREPEPFPVTSAKPFRPHRRLKPKRPEVAPSAAEVEAPFVDVATRWDTWADDDDASRMLDDEQSDEADAELPAVVAFTRALTPQSSPDPPSTAAGEPSRVEARAAARSRQRDQLRRMINAGHRPPPPPPPSTVQTQRADEQPPPPPQPQPQSPPPPIPQPAIPTFVEKTPPPPKPPQPPPPAPSAALAEKATPVEPRRRQPRQRQRQRQPPKPPQQPKKPQPTTAHPQPKVLPPQLPPLTVPSPPPPPPSPPPSLPPEPALDTAEEVQQTDEELQYKGRSGEQPDVAMAARGGDQGIQDDPSAAGEGDGTDYNFADRQGVQDLPSIRLELLPSSDSGGDDDAGWELDVDAGGTSDEEVEAEHPMSRLELQEEMDEGEDEESEDEEEPMEDGMLESELSDSGDEERGLLAEILAEPWFRIANVAQAKAPVATALTDLMSEADSGSEHRQMCQRLLDIKRQLSLEVDLEISLIASIVAQLEQLIAGLRCTAAAASDEAAELSLLFEIVTDDNGSSLARQKGDDLLELLRSFGHEVADLSKRWTGALLAATLAVAEERDRRHSHRRRRHHQLPDSGLGTDSNATTTSEDTEPQQPPLPQERLVALTEELERLTATATAPSSASLAGLQELLDPQLDEVDAPPTAVRFELPPVEPAIRSAGSSPDDGLRPVQERVWLPPVPTPPKPHRRPKLVDTKEELSVFDLMGDYRLKKMVEYLPKIEPMRLDEISERSRQTPYRCPRLVGRLPWLDHQTGWLSDRSGQQHQMVRPDPTNYLASWRPTSIADWPSLRWPSEGIDGAHNDGNLDASGADKGQTEPGLGGSEKSRRPKKMAKGAVTKFQELLPAVQELPPVASDRLSDLWDGHCRMERLARHGMHRAGMPIGPFMARDAMLLQPLSDK